MNYDLFMMDDVSGSAKGLLIKLYVYLKPKMDFIEFCQECGCEKSSAEITELFNYVEKYYPEEIEKLNNVTTNK